MYLERKQVFDVAFAHQLVGQKSARIGMLAPGEPELIAGST